MVVEEIALFFQTIINALLSIVTTFIDVIWAFIRSIILYIAGADTITAALTILLPVLLIPILFDFSRTVFKTVILVSDSIIGRLRRAVQKRKVRFTPSVSIIVPAHNEEKVIEKNIQSLLELDYPNKEIVVVDDYSTDDTYKIASKYSEKGQIKLFHRDIQSGKKALAVNYGLLFATGEIVVVIDADTIIERGSISKIVEDFKNPKVGAVSGNVRVLNKRNLLSRLQAYEYLTSMEIGRRYQSLTRTLMVIPGAIGAFRKDLLTGVGAYDTDTMTEDFDATLKIHKTHSKVRFESRAIGYTSVPEKWRQWIRQRTRWSIGQLQTISKHRDMLMRPKFGVIGVLAVPDMVFTDIILLLIRWVFFAAMIVMAVFLPSVAVAIGWPVLWELPRMFAAVFLFYAFIEFVSFLSAALLSPRKRDLMYIVYLPVMLFFYRPLYSVVRLKGYVDKLRGKKGKW